MIQTIILDLDGPLLDGKFRHYACYSQILQKYGYAPLSLDHYWQMKRARISRREQLAASQADTIYEDFLQDWLELIEHPNLLALDRLQPNVFHKLEQWRNYGIQLIVITLRSKPENLYHQLTHFGLDTILDQVLTCDHQLGAKGKSSQLKKAIPNLSSQSSLWVGDTEIDIEAARLLGCPIWAVSCGLRTESYLASLSPDFLSSDLTSINLRYLDGN
jgi:phosphoglycolate phosphatase-like HAD superfamily hydrolase